jgi:phage tail sheath protein FI
MYTQVTAESHSIVNGKCKLSFYPLDNPVITKSDDSSTTYVKGTDYTLDAYGNFTIISAAITDSSLKFTYKKLNPAGITGSVLIGTYTGSTGVRTGLQLFDIAKNTYGYFAKILIAPTYSALTAVSAEMLVKAEKYRAIALLRCCLWYICINCNFKPWCRCSYQLQHIQQTRYICYIRS